MIKLPKLRPELRIALLYGVFGGLWILLSDRVVNSLVGDPQRLAELQTYKGWLFVLLSTLLIYALLRRENRLRQATESSLIESEERYRQLFENSMDAILLTAPDGSIFAANPAACRMLDRSEEEIIRVGRSGVLDPSDPRLPLAIEQRSRTGYFHGELTFLRKDGSSFPGEITTNLFKNREGRERTSMIIRDITERKNGEAALRESEARYRNLFLSNPHPMWVYDLETLQFLEVNDAAVAHYGYSRQEFLEMNLEDIRPPEDIPFLMDELKKEQPSYKSPRVWRHRLKSGQIIFVEISTHAFDFAGRAARLVLAMDVTERLANERAIRELNLSLERRVHERTAQLSAANNALEAFTYSVSHDLRAPLRAINGFSQILVRRYSASVNEQARQYLHNVLNASEMMGQLIDDLLKYSRMGKQGIRLVPTPLQGLIESLADGLSGELAEIGGKISIANDLPWVLGDQTLLRQTFSNLLENAVMYRKIDTSLHIQIDWQADGEYTIIAVRDNGIGIPAEFHEKVFVLFQRLHSQEAYPGTGIGLATVRKSVDLLGGRVWVESQVDQGSVFNVRVLRADPDSA